MKNAICHDDKMEAYCNAIRALEDKFYDIKLNRVPRRYNEKVDELAKIASGQITVPPNVFARDVMKPSVNLELTPSCSPYSRAMARMRPRPWRLSQLPRARDWRAKYLA
jgi:hypothetical protein